MGQSGDFPLRELNAGSETVKELRFWGIEPLRLSLIALGFAALSLVNVDRLEAQTTNWPGIAGADLTMMRRL
jgi:hypothetical protein